jgi:hypothetical protein
LILQGQLALNRWIVSEAAKTAKAVAARHRNLEFSEAAGAIYLHLGCVLRLVSNSPSPCSRAMTPRLTRRRREQRQPGRSTRNAPTCCTLHALCDRGVVQAIDPNRGLLITREWPKLDDNLIDTGASAKTG